MDWSKLNTMAWSKVWFGISVLRDNYGAEDKAKWLIDYLMKREGAEDPWLKDLSCRERSSDERYTCYIDINNSFSLRRKTPNEVKKPKLQKKSSISVFTEYWKTYGARRTSYKQIHQKPCWKLQKSILRFGRILYCKIQQKVVENLKI